MSGEFPFGMFGDPEDLQRQMAEFMEQAQQSQKNRYDTDSEQFSASAGVENAKFNPKSLRFVNLEAPDWGRTSPCREATRPLQVIPMLLRPGLGRKVQWSGSPAVSPEIFVETV